MANQACALFFELSVGSLLSLFTGYTVFLWDLSTNVKADSNNICLSCLLICLLSRKKCWKSLFLLT